MTYIVAITKTFLVIFTKYKYFIWWNFETLTSDISSERESKNKFDVLEEYYLLV